MWKYRELIKNLTVADFKNRYQNTVLGFFWSLLSPLLFAGVLYFVFRNVFGQNLSFALYIVVGIMAWRFFNLGTSSSLTSIVSKSNLVTKVYIPRQILVLSTVLANLISSVLEFIILLPIIFAVQGSLPLTILFFPILHILYFFFIYGGGLLLAAFFVYFRDLNQIWEVLTNILFFSSPIIYPLTAVGPVIMPYYMFNPITHFVLNYQKIMVTGELPTLLSISYIIIIDIALCIMGILVFNRLQRRFAEEI